MDDRAHWLALAEGLSDDVVEAHYRALYANSRDIIVSIRPDASIAAINPRGCDLIGTDGESLRGQPVTVLFSDDCAPAVLGLLRSGYIGDSGGVVVLRGGNRATLSVSRFYDDTRTLLVLRDITHAHHLQRTITGINHLAAELAADIATPLAVIEGQIALLLAQPDISPRAMREQLQRLRSHSQRISHTVRNLQAVAAPGAPHRKLSRLDVVLDEVLQDVGRRRRRVRVERDLQPPDLRVYADPGQLRQILRNLVFCAIDHSPSGRSVRLSAWEGGHRAWVQVEDEGEPPSDELLAAINETSGNRPPGPAAGLPLTSAWKLAQRNGGSLRVARRSDGGGAAILELPQRPSDPTALGRQLLVVDRERLLHETVSWMLADQDIAVTSVSSVEAAAGLCARRRFDAVLVTTLAGELVAMLRGQQPALLERVVRVGEGGLQTPFTRQELLAVLGELT